MPLETTGERARLDADGRGRAGPDGPAVTLDVGARRLRVHRVQRAVGSAIAAARGVRPEHLGEHAREDAARPPATAAD